LSLTHLINVSSSPFQSSFFGWLRRDSQWPLALLEYGVFRGDRECAKRFRRRGLFTEQGEGVNVPGEKAGFAGGVGGGREGGGGGWGLRRGARPRAGKEISKARGRGDRRLCPNGGV